MMDRNILVTGGLGFIGKNFCALNSDRYQSKFILDKVTYASDLDFYHEVLKPAGWVLIVSDIVEINKVDYLRKVENLTVVNFAAESHVDASFGNSDLFYQSNVFGALRTSEFCLANNYSLLHISTDEVYGEQVSDKASEEDPLTPTNPYSAAKAAADILVQTYIKCFNLNAKILRPTNAYGPKQLNEKVIPKAIDAALNNEQFFIHGYKDLARHFLHVNDLSEGIQKVLDNWNEDMHTVYNISGAHVIKIRELVEFIYKFYDRNLGLIAVTDDRPFNDEMYNIDDQKIRNLGWSPQEDFWQNIELLCLSESFIRRSF